MKNTIRRIPLLFLFVPTLLVAVVLFSFFDVQHRVALERQLKVNAEHVLFRVAQISRQYLYHRQYGELKQALWTFVDEQKSNIDNIAIYDKDGQFITTLNLDEQFMELSQSDIIDTPFVREHGLYHAYGRIGTGQYSQSQPQDEKIIGFIRLSFAADELTLSSISNVIITCVIIFICLLMSVVLWRFRYIQFHQQLSITLEFLTNLNKGYKQDKLSADSSYIEINQLQQQINALVGYYEKRVTIKQFEVIALEQTVKETNESVNSKLAELVAVVDNKEQNQSNTTSLLTLLYQVVYQTLQAQLATIEDTVNNHVNGHDSNREAEQKVDWPQQVNITYALNNLNQMLSEIKRLADTSTGQLRQQPEYISLSVLITSIVHFVRPLVNKKSLEFILCQPDNPIDVEVDINQMQQVLIALMQSAVLATGKGYIKLTVDTAKLTQKPDHTNHQLLCCKVQDSGSGLNDRQLAMLLTDEIDSRLSDDSWISQGLRLMVIKKSIEDMGGNFMVKSLAGLGTEYSVALECKVSHSHGHDLSLYHGCQVMIYDPVFESGHVIYEKLCEHGMLVELCREPIEVFNVLNKSAVDCAIFCRPVEAQLRHVFDQSLAAIIAVKKIEKCQLLVSDETGLVGIPKSWQVAEKPFVLTAFTDYFDYDDCAKTASDGNQAKDAAEVAMTLLKASKTIEILAVDDNETNLKLLSVILRQYPVNLVQALSGREALKLSQKQAFDVILMDKEMPEMSGLETSLNIRQLPINKHTPIVMFSAHVDEEEHSHMLRQGINDCLEKPLDQQKLYYLMETWCAKRWRTVGGAASAP